MGRLLSVIAGVFVGWSGPDTAGSMVAYVLSFAFLVALIAVTYWLKAQLRPSPDSVVEAFAPMPLALYIRAGKAVWHGEIFWGELVWEYVRIFFLSSVFIGVVAFLTRFVKTFLR